MPFSKAQMVWLAGVAVLAVLSLVMALRGSRGMWFTFASTLLMFGMAWNWRRNNSSK